MRALAKGHDRVRVLPCVQSAMGSPRHKAPAMQTSEPYELEHIVALLPDVVWIKDVDGRYTNCSQRFCELTGLTRAQVLGKADRDIFAAEQAEVFTRLLDQFCANHASDMGTLGAKLEENDFETAHRLAHSLKGVAAMLGMATIQTLAADLEKDLKKPQDIGVLVERAKTLEEIVATMIHDLTEVLPKEAPAVQPLDPSNLVQKAQELRRLLQSDDSLAGVQMRALHGAFVSVDPTGASKLLRQVENFDFGEAIKTLDALMKQHRA